jgi:hypothetical protein
VWDKEAMLIRLLTAIITFVVLFAAGMQAQGGRATGGTAAIRACTVLPASEVKRLVGLPDPLNLYTKLPPEEETIGRGSSCTYPNVHVQIDPFVWSTIDSVRTKTPAAYEAIPGVGEAAYLHVNKKSSVEFAELYARIGTHVLTIQLDVPDGKTTAALKPNIIALAQAYAAKLR